MPSRHVVLAGRADQYPSLAGCWQSQESTKLCTRDYDHHHYHRAATTIVIIAAIVERDGERRDGRGRWHFGGHRPLSTSLLYGHERIGTAR